MEVIGGLVSLRFLEPNDAEELLELRLANREFFRPLEPTVGEFHFTLEGQKADIARIEQERANDESYVFGIFENSTGAIAGRVGLSAVFRKAWQNANLGYYVGQEFNGRGFGTEAVKLAVRYAFESARLHRVQAAVMSGNVASRRVLEKAGFRLEGLARNYLKINDRWEDHHIYAATIETWQEGEQRAQG
jgi:[ribosomal protein S5]-alanine N-acetyltransferase